MARARARAGIGRWLLLSALIVLFDQLTKVLVVRSFTLGQRRPVIDGFFDLTLVYNKGAAFSFLAGAERPTAFRTDSICRRCHI